jgi:hypothetical protein
LAHALTGLDAVGPEKLGDRKEKPPQPIEISQNAEENGGLFNRGGGD